MSKFNCSHVKMSRGPFEGNVNEKDKFFNLGNAELNNIIKEGVMLDDNHIYKFQELLEFESNGTIKMQNSAYLQMLDEITAIDKNQKHIRILFSGSPALGHWICTYYD